MLTVTPEPAGLEPFGMERCCRCDTRTRFWYAPKDVALCEPCAANAVEADIPSKPQWIADQRRRHPSLVGFNGMQRGA